MLVIGTNKEEIRARGSWVNLSGEWYYKISGAQAMPAFFMGIVSSSNHWMFPGSKGGITAGRINPDHALFPYYTSDKVMEGAGITGSFTAIRIKQEGKTILWEPFSELHGLLYHTELNLYKNVPGNKLVYESVNHDLKLVFRYNWTTSPRYGFVRRAEIEYGGSGDLDIELLDGLQNILPAGLNEQLQNARSNLVDAYKKQERVPATNLVLYRLSSIIIDRPIPAEALSCNVCYLPEVGEYPLFLSSLQVEAFRKGQDLAEETEIKGEKGAFLVQHRFTLSPGQRRDWLMVADVDQDHSSLTALMDELQDPEKLKEAILRDIDLGTRQLNQIVASSDGLQSGSDKKSTGRHYANVLYNVMRGGLFDDQYRIPSADFVACIKRSNKEVYTQNKAFLEALPEKIDRNSLLEQVRQTGSADFERLALDYLPLFFSRRHGDPSRPWNRFSIETETAEGERKLYYEGNWRDIFQNWEALLYAYPDFIPNVLAKFVNASTIDGYNPYRIGSYGIDWEKTEPDDPWSFIGYWGDHQIIYLLKLLEAARNFNPEALQVLLAKPVFAYANVPYRIRSYSEILDNPKETIDYDAALEAEIGTRVKALGSDGKLVTDGRGRILQVNFVEKLLLTFLTKISNFVPDGGIWLNTQRPEWNDANNALVGNGLSMVTLSYMYRYVVFLHELLERSGDDNYELTEALHEFFRGIYTTLENHRKDLDFGFSDLARKTFTDTLGKQGERYRQKVYRLPEVINRRRLDKKEMLDFCVLCKAYLERSILNNRRSDRLFHAYNLLSRGAAGYAVGHLYEMLEGQVAVLSSGVLPASEAIALLKAMKSGPLYRQDQHSYLLYPDRDLPVFLATNQIPEVAVAENPLLVALLSSDNRAVIRRDSRGHCHFHPSFKNRDDLNEALDGLSGEDFNDLLVHHRQKTLDLFESLFNHHAFTGRSGTFFGYEGLGSIYWHMVSKLLLAVQEVFFAAVAKNESVETCRELADHYYDIRAGLGWEKEPDNYGAFPTDPYSHTPARRGAQQPGMTGQVKEDMLARIGEIGILVANGRLHFRPWLFRREELLNQAEDMIYFDVNNTECRLELEAGSFGFTICQVPVVYQESDQNKLYIYYRDGSVETIQGSDLGLELSNEVFSRSGKIEKLVLRTKFADWQ